MGVVVEEGRLKLFCYKLRLGSGFFLVAVVRGDCVELRFGF